MGIFDFLFGSEPTQESCNTAAKDLQALRQNGSWLVGSANQMAASGNKASLSEAQKNILAKESKLEASLKACREAHITPAGPAGGKPKSNSEELANEI